MPTLSTMPQYEQDQADESPALRKFREAMGASRFSRLMATYVLRDEIDADLCNEEEILKRFAKAAGTSPEAMQADLRWARCIDERDLRGAFAAEGIPDLEWSERITLEHLRTMARAAFPDGAPLGSKDRAAWLVSTYHADETAAELKDRLRKAGLLKVRQPKALPAEEEERLIMEARESIGRLVDLMSGDRGANVAKKVKASLQRRLKVLGDTVDLPQTWGALLIAVGQSLIDSGEDEPLPAPARPGTYRVTTSVRRAYEALMKNPERRYTLGTNEGEQA